MSETTVKESNIDVGLRDGKVSQGTFWEVDPTGPLVLMVHGLTSDRNSSPFAVGARELASAGISTFRPDLYGGEPEGRNLLDCDVDTHAQDIEDISQHLRSLHPGRPLVALGHSLGGLSLVASKARFDGLTLLDASHPSAFPYTAADALSGQAEDEWTTWRADLGCYETGGGISMLVSKELRASIVRPANDEIKQVTEPLLVVWAEHGVLEQGAREYHTSAPTTSKRLLMAPGADHCFDNFGTAEHTFREISMWVRSLALLPKL